AQRDQSHVRCAEQTSRPPGRGYPARQSGAGVVRPMTAQKKKIRLQYVRSKICTPIKHKLVVKGLGFTRLYQVIEREDTPSIRGMVAKIPHLVQILEK